MIPVPKLEAVVRRFAEVEQLLASRYGWHVHVPSPDGVAGPPLVSGRGRPVFPG